MYLCIFTRVYIYACIKIVICRKSKRYYIMAELSEQEQIRRNSLNELKKLGINPYPAALYELNANSAEILEEYPRLIVHSSVGDC